MGSSNGTDGTLHQPDAAHLKPEAPSAHLYADAHHPSTGSAYPLENAHQAQTETLVRNGSLPKLDIGNEAAAAVARGLAYEAVHNPAMLAMNTGMALTGQPIPLMAETAAGTALANPRAALAVGEGVLVGAAAGPALGGIGASAGIEIGRHAKM